MSDAVAYDELRARVNDATARLLAVAQGSSDGADAARSEVIELRRESLAVDGFDRAEVDAFLAQLEEHSSAPREGPE
ncbi:hypothetical protein [Microbacterium sulfonylureivorans]|uniref:hypothetical protein n=1 Tax=Microbacterium sulfonylureivorans TaxID=2486854 RepID=UPI000FD86279|nr:hypothetical protein [Microbacterium sulfonylureivorans]